MPAKKYHLGDVLSITSGYLLSPTLMDGVCSILSFMVGESLFTHVLPRAADVCGPVLLKQFPQLNDIVFPDFSVMRPHEINAWVDEATKTYGKDFDILPLSETDTPNLFQSRDPIEELVEMRAQAQRRR